VAHAPAVLLSDDQRSQIERWSRGGSTPYRLVVRSRIVLLAANGHSNREIARLLSTNPITVARWRSRFILLGLEGIRNEAPRSGSPPPVSEEVVRAVIAKTLNDHPRGRTHWTTRSMARVVGVSHSTVRRIWKSYGIRPNRSRLSQLAVDPRFRPRKATLAGVYVNPPQRAVALSLSDGSSARPVVLHRRPGVDPGSSRPLPGTWMKELVTTLNLLDRQEPVRTSKRHLEQEFLSFLRFVQNRRTANEKIVLLAEPGGPSLSPQLSRWLSRHPQVSTEFCAGPDIWKEKVVEFIRDASENRAEGVAPGGLPKFLTAVDRWKKVSVDGQRPFAWTD